MKFKNKATLSRVTLILLLFFGLQYVSFRTNGADNPNPSNRYYHKIQAGRELMTQLLDKFPGISIAVGVDNQIVWKEGFGWADAKNKVFVTPKSQFRYYSLSKSLTGMAAAKLMEEGKLDLDTTVTYYLPDLPKQYCDVKVSELLSHTAGVRHYKKNEWMKLAKYHCNTVAEALPTFINDKLEFEPGQGYKYSSFGYVLLCHVLEVASGMPYEDYIKQNFFDPLGLEDVGLDRSPEAMLNPVKFYDKWNGWRGLEALKVDNSCKFGGGGYVGTAEDLVQIHEALLHDRFMKPETVEKYFTSFTKSDDTPVEYAFGIGVKTAQDGSKYYAHTGTAMGGYGVLIVEPKQKLVIVILGNRFDEAMIPTAKKILKLFNGTV